MLKRKPTESRMSLTFLLCGLTLVISACDFSDNQSRTDKNVNTLTIDELVKDSQELNKLGNYQELFVAPFKGGYAVVHASTPKGLNSKVLAFYWVQNKQKVYAINEAAINLSPAVPRYPQLPIEINPAELLTTVKKSY